MSFKLKTKNIFYILLISLLLLVVSCGGINHNIIMKPTQKYQAKTVEIVKDPSSIQTDCDQIFVDHLYKELKDVGFTKGTEATLKIQYKVTKYNPGNNALRMFFGIFGAGKGTLDIEVSYLQENNIISKTTLNVVLKKGTGYKGMFTDAAEEISEYIEEKLKK